MGTGALAQEGVAVGTDPAPAGGYHEMVIGGQISMGMATVLTDDDDDDSKPRFAGGGFAYFDYYVSEMLAIEAGLGFIGKGARYEEGDLKLWMKPIYMEIPLGVKLNIQNFRVGILFAFDIGIGGKFKGEFAGHEEEDDIEWDEDGYPRNFNIAPKITLGYAIPVGPVDIVPGLDWAMNLLDDDDDDDDNWYRNMNLMFNVAVEFGF